MPLPSDPPAVSLRGGLTVPLAALRLLWTLEEKGVVLRVQGGRLVASLPGGITPDDAAVIRAHRNVLLALVASCEAI